MGSMIVCGVRPPPGFPTEIPQTAYGIDDAVLNFSSIRLQNSRELLDNWHEEYPEDSLKPPSEIKPFEFINWCQESSYITDWLRLITNLCQLGSNVEPWFTIAHGGISDTERITILPPKLMNLLEMATSTDAVAIQFIQGAILPMESPVDESPFKQTATLRKATSHSFVCTKKNPEPLDDAITMAIAHASDPTNYKSIWESLRVLALQPNRPTVLLGYVDNEGVKYINEKKEGGCGFFTKGALKARLTRWSIMGTNAEKEISKAQPRFLIDKLPSEI